MLLQRPRRVSAYTAGMRSSVALIAVAALLLPAVAGAQTRTRKPVRKPPAPAALTTAAPAVSCPDPLGKGLTTGAAYCFVMAGTEASQGVIVTLPPRTGPATLIFDLHNRHTYSEEYVKSGRGYAKYTAGIAVLAMNMDVIGRALVQSEFRTAADLLERIGGGAGPSGAKAVVPLGQERVYITIPAGIDKVSLLGEILEAETSIGRETATPGRPVALVSNIQLEYRPRR